MYHKKIIPFKILRSCCPYIRFDNKCTHKNSFKDNNANKCLSSTCPFDRDNLATLPKKIINDEGYESILIECGINATKEELAIINLVERYKEKWYQRLDKGAPYIV